MKKLLYFISIIVIVFLVSAFIPMNTSKKNCVEVTGIIKSISEGGARDLVFELEDDKIRYYINRGLDNRFELEKSKVKFIGKKVTLNYANSWTPLAPFGTTNKHIKQISIENKEVYSEF